ncbi:MAG: PTS transporter subunit EIIC [Eubacteriales bacterium]|nr:PTS transporter subunit EIIC [Eubacteriales bacterium]
MSSNRQIAENVLKAVGGKENVSMVTHCMTRLRFNLKKTEGVSADEVKKIDGVLSVVEAGGQFQVVIGTNVSKVYNELCEIGGFAKQKAVEENLDKPKEKLTVKGFFNGILNGVAGCMTPLIPLLLVAGLLKMIPTLFGPACVGILDPESDLYTLFTFLGDTGFYFLPVALGYTGAKKFGATPILGILLGAMLIHPTFAAMAATEGATFTVFGIPCVLHDYNSTVVPMILATWFMGYVERFFKKYIPESLTTVFTPFLTIVVMIPLTFCFFGPVGYWIGDLIGNLLNGLHDVAGPIGFALVAALWSFLLACGMHLVLITLAFVNIGTVGYDNFVLAASALAGFATYGVLLGGFIRAKRKDTKSQILAYFIANFLGGVGEPALYGFILKYKKPMLGQVAGGFAGGLVGGLAGITVYQLSPAMNFLNFLGYVGGSVSNVVWAAISAAVAVVVGCIVTIVFGFDEEEA